MPYVYAFEEGSQGAEVPARRQGRQPRRDDEPRPARAARLHDHAPTRARPTWPRGDELPAGLMDEVAAALARARGEDGQAARRRRRPAARVGALGRAVLDAGDDGHGPQPRAQRRVGAGPREADRQRALRVRLVPPLRADVRQDRARRPRRRCSRRRCTTSSRTKGVDRRHRARRPTTSRVWSRRSRRSCTTEAGVEFPHDPHGAARLRDRGGVQVVERRAGARLPPHGEDPRRPRHRGQRADDGVRQQGRRLRHRRRVHAQPVDRREHALRRLPHERAGRRRRRRHPHHRAARRDGQRVPRVPHSSCST